MRDVSRELGSAGVGLRRFQVLPGQSSNRAYRAWLGVEAVTVKVHSLAGSGDAVFRRITLADQLLRGLPWYPPVLSAVYAPQGRLVVVRPFIGGSICALDDARVHELAEIARLLADLSVPSGLSRLEADFATEWLATDEHDELLCDLAAFPETKRAVRRWLPETLDAARRLTGPESRLAHGDLHVRNLLRTAGGPVLLDWDEVSVSRRPVDVAKGIWLLARRQRGSFHLDANRLQMWWAGAPQAVAAGASLLDTGLLGAIWFLPRRQHVKLLRDVDSARADWYLTWVASFWASFEDNLHMVAETSNRAGGR